MKCDDTKLLLMDFLYDEIEPGAEKLLRTHLEICAGCRGEYEALQRTSVMLQAWKDEEPSQSFVFVEQRSSWLEALKGVLFPAHAPLWGRLAFGLGVAAVTMLVLSAALNLEINYDEGRFSYKTSLAPRQQNELTVEARSQLVEELQRENSELIARLMQAGYEQQRTELDRKLVSLATELNRQRQNDLMLVGRGLEEVQQRAATRFDQTNQMLNQLIRVANPPRE